MDSSVRLADIHKRVPAYGTEAGVIVTRRSRVVAGGGYWEDRDSRNAMQIHANVRSEFSEIRYVPAVVFGRWQPD